jgi:hypothetical protein
LQEPAQGGLIGAENFVENKVVFGRQRFFIQALSVFLPFIEKITQTDRCGKGDVFVLRGAVKYFAQNT